MVDALASLAAAAASRRPDADRRARRAWRLLAVAFAVRPAGDGSWWWLEAVRHEDPFPSIADGFVLASSRCCSRG